MDLDSAVRGQGRAVWHAQRGAEKLRLFRIRALHPLGPCGMVRAAHGPVRYRARAAVAQG